MLATLRYVEGRIARMMDIWGGLSSLEDTAAAPARHGAVRLDGPKLDGDPGHASQADIDALFRGQ